MRITDLLDVRSISLDSAPKSKSEALDQAVELMVRSGKIDDVEAYRKQVYAREEESTTGIGEGDYKEAFKLGVCTGSASAFSEQLATREQVEAIRNTHHFEF